LLDGFAVIGGDPPAAATADIALQVGENGSGMRALTVMPSAG
jgi:hypothetical protein